MPKQLYAIARLHKTENQWKLHPIRFLYYLLSSQTRTYTRHYIFKLYAGLRSGSTCKKSFTHENAAKARTDYRPCCHQQRALTPMFSLFTCKSGGSGCHGSHPKTLQLATWSRWPRDQDEDMPVIERPFLLPASSRMWFYAA